MQIGTAVFISTQKLLREISCEQHTSHFLAQSLVITLSHTIKIGVIWGNTMRITIVLKFSTCELPTIACTCNISIFYSLGWSQMYEISEMQFIILLKWALYSDWGIIQDYLNMHLSMHTAMHWVR